MWNFYIMKHIAISKEVNQTKEKKMKKKWWNEMTLFSNRYITEFTLISIKYLIKLITNLCDVLKNKHKHTP